MSGNRANAAARQRRAGGGPEPQMPSRAGAGRGFAPPPQMKGVPQMQAQAQAQAQTAAQIAAQAQLAAQNGITSAPKQMSISNAVALMTIRLSRVETFMQKFESEDANEGSRMVDHGVFDSIVSRLDALERGHKLLASSKPQVVSMQSSDATSDSESVNDLKESVRGLKEELAEVKNMLLKLQSFTMETNQRLTDMVFQNENENVDENGDENGEENGEENITLVEESEDIISSSVVNLKELVQQELASE